MASLEVEKSYSITTYRGKVPAPYYNTSITKAYNALFEKCNPGSMYYHRAFQHISPVRMYLVLMDMLSNINGHPFHIRAWFSLKASVQKLERAANVGIFLWDRPPLRGDYSHVSVDVDWNLVNTSAGYYLAYVLLQRSIHTSGLVPSITPTDLVAPYKV